MIELKNITKTFNPGTVNEHKAIDNLNLVLKEGDFVTVIGSNGAGKSTLLNIISGSIDADTGYILLNGTNVANLSEHRRAPYFGHVFQDPMKGTATDMTVIENLALARGRGKKRSVFRWSISGKDKAYYEEKLKSLGLGLESRLYQKVGLLSGGQRQAITLLMATISQKPSFSQIRKDYVKFNPARRDEAKEEVERVYHEQKEIYKNAVKEIVKNHKLNSSEKSHKIKEAYKAFDTKMREYDVTKPVLLLDEHTAALDPKTAAKVLEITERIVREQHLTTIMITHNMNDAIKYGNRLIMMSKGKITVDVSGEEKKKLTISNLLDMFSNASDNDVLSDSAILG
ncbi:MAG: ATP-binding cassette domain-containing protein [Bacilli bacterium]|nr:ATP-binding cassette domain-containing protein [Bacilli bacterium]